MVTVGLGTGWCVFRCRLSCFVAPTISEAICSEWITYSCHMLAFWDISTSYYGVLMSNESWLMNAERCTALYHNYINNISKLNDYQNFISDVSHDNNSPINYNSYSKKV